MSVGSTVKAFFDNVKNKDVPVILVGAGPSLEKNVKELKNVNKRALIISFASEGISTE